MRVKGIKLNAKWLRETLNYNVVEYLEQADCPVLAETAEKDLQVPPEHARVITESVPGESEWPIIPDMNHFLKEYGGEHPMLGLMKECKSIADKPILPKFDGDHRGMAGKAKISFNKINWRSGTIPGRRFFM